jgi:hypothetical protein
MDRYADDAACVLDAAGVERAWWWGSRWAATWPSRSGAGTVTGAARSPS